MHASVFFFFLVKPVIFEWGKTFCIAKSAVVHRQTFVIKVGRRKSELQRASDGPWCSS